MAKSHCLITNSFKASVHFETSFMVEAAKVAAEALAQAG
jgi:hypothetical protein